MLPHPMQVICTNPGKFEGEPLYVEDFWQFVLGGAEDETIDDNETPVAVFLLDTDQRTRYGFDEQDHALLIWESDQGFVNSRIMSETELTRFRAECETPSEDEAPNEPEESDLTTEDHERFWQDGKLVITRDGDIWYAQHGSATNRPMRTERLGAFGDDHIAALRAYMDATQFWPNVWLISDHGNAHLIDMSADREVSR